MTNLTTSETRMIVSFLKRIRAELYRPTPRKLAIHNYCDKVSVIINKAERRHK